MKSASALLVLIASTTLLSTLIVKAKSVEKDSQAEDVAILYALSSEKMSLHEPVLMTLKVQNNTSESIHLELGQDRKEGFQFALTKPDGKKVQLPVLIREGASRIGSLEVQSGETYSQKLVLNEWYDFSSPGKYKIDGQMSKPIILAHGTQNKRDQGFQVILEIGPRDELSLTRTCDAFANLIDESNSYQEAADAAFALSYVEDPIAVPYLRRALLANKLVEPLAISGLEKIANDAAVRVLVEGLKMESADAAVLSRSALTRIRKQTRDPELRQEIDTALE